jgi:hypothetical protein
MFSLRLMLRLRSFVGRSVTPSSGLGPASACCRIAVEGSTDYKVLQMLLFRVRAIA